MQGRDDLMRTSRGYWASRTLLTAVEIGLFEELGGRRRTAANLAENLRTEPRATALLLDALAGLGVLVKTGRSYAIPTPLRPLLSPRGPESALGMLRHHAHLWHTWSGLTESVRTGRHQRSDSSFRRGPEEARAFTEAMRDGARRLAPGVAAEVDLRGRRRLLDLGGGPGEYAAAFARRNPELKVVVVDLPNVAEVGEAMLADHPDVRDRISYHAADLDTDPLPVGDAAFLSHVIHANGEDTNRALFRRIARALEPGGMLVVRDFLLDEDGTTPPPSSLFALNMLVNTPEGRCYRVVEIASWLRQAGFGRAKRLESTVSPDAAYVVAERKA
jgi:SAM-dependent methyltransferase